jgi:hypothetical protein
VGDLLLLAGIAFLAHGLLLLNDALYWDDWILFPHLQRHDWLTIDAIAREAGMTPLNSAFFHMFAYAPGGVFSFKLTVFILIVCIALLVYLIALEAGVSRLTAFCIAALQMVFPGFQDWVLLATAPSIFDLTLFLVATLLLVRAERAGPRARLVLIVAAIALFILSFGFLSLLPLYFGSLLLLLLVALRAVSLRQLVRTRWLYAAGLILLPIAYWEVSSRALVTSGLYTGVYSFTGRPSVVFRSFTHFVRNGILEQMLQSLAVMRNPWIWPLLAALVALLVVARRRVVAPAILVSRPALAGALFGGTALVLAMVPYALVGKFPAVHGWDSRHDLLIGIPLAVVIVALASLALPDGRRAWIGIGLVGFVAAGFAGAGIQDYLGLQARWATDRAVMAELRDTSNAGRFSVYWVHDNAPGPEDYYRFYEWSAMLGNTYGDQSRVGLDVRVNNSRFLQRPQFFSDRYNLANFDSHGCQADLTITRTSSAGSSDKTGLMYDYYSLFQPDRLDSYIRGLVTIQVTPTPSASATDCSK